MPAILYKTKAGERVPGTTTVISSNLGWNKQPLMYWAWAEGIEGRNYRETSQKAADAGTIAHYLVECDIKGKKPDTSQYPKELVDKAETCYLNYIDWKDTVNFKLVESEISIVSEQYRYGSTIDCIAEIKGKLALFDWKSSGGVYSDYLIQIAAYKENWQENNPDRPLSGIYLLRIDKENAAWAFHYWESLPDAWEAFKYLLKLHDLNKTLKKT